MSLPNVAEVRKKIEAVTDPLVKHWLMTQYLVDGRPCELAARRYRSDRAQVYGQHLTASLTRELGHEATLIEVTTAKRLKEKGLEPQNRVSQTTRVIALPLEYEPWAKQVHRWITTHKPPFNCYKQDINTYVLNNQTFGDLTYPIEYYELWENGEIIAHKEEHTKPFRLHALRHLRTTELVEVYDFDGIDLALYGGWSFRRIAQAEGMQSNVFSGAGALAGAMKRYAHIQYKRYFPKLLRKPNWSV